MGVHGLWRLIEPSGKPVPLETLENKVLAVDVSIWLHQAIKGFQDSKGGYVPNAHLLGIYHRVCKLLYFRIKPVFVFDGGVPALKKQTIAKRNQQKSKTISETDRIQKQLLSTLLKHSAINKVLSEKIEEASTSNNSTLQTRQRNDELFKLPSPDIDSTLSTSTCSEDESSYTETTDSSPTKNWDLHNIDTHSPHFKSLPVEVRHDILTDLKETRKQSSWGKLHDIPTISDDFATYQMKRLLKRQSVQTALEETEKEMGGHSLSLAELESLLNDQGVITKENAGYRIASDENKRYLLIKDTKKAMEEARKQEERLQAIHEDTVLEPSSETNEIIQSNSKAEQEFESDLQAAIKLSLEESQPSTSTQLSHSSSSSIHPRNKLEFSYLENFTDADFASSSSEDEFIQEVTVKNKSSLSSAKGYMMEYSGLTPNEIQKILHRNDGNSSQPKSDISQNSENIRKSFSSEGKDKGYETEISNKSVENLANTADEVEIMSSSATSDSEDLIDVDEVKAGQDCTKTHPVLEIVVDPANKLPDDDLFSDIFDNGPSETSSVSNVQLFSIKSKTLKDVICDQIVEHSTLSTKDHVIEIPKPEDQDTKIVVENQSKPDTSEVPTCITKQNIVSSEFKDEDLQANFKDNSSKSAEVGVDEFNTDTSEVPTSDTNQSTNKTVPKLSVNELKKMKDDLRQESFDLANEKAIKERMVGNISEQIYQESQELLQLFGIPFIIAPMEAEAQCAFLDEINLTDGTITDDSDIWLFGGKTVYKNFFNQNKYVLEFREENINHHFKLTREQMILLALLVGSDYTVGIQGVGPVTAMEILSTFPPAKLQEIRFSHNQMISGLSEFRSWFKKGKSPGPGRAALKGKLKNIQFTENFPSLKVVEAYLDPKVDTSREPFTWGKPDIVALTEFARTKFGWTSVKTQEILLPVIKRMEESRTQKTIKDYFKLTHKIDSGNVTAQMSKRVRTAIDNIGKDPSERVAIEVEEAKRKIVKKRDKTTTKKRTKSVNIDKTNKQTSTTTKSKSPNSNDAANSASSNYLETSEDLKTVSSIQNKTNKKLAKSDNTHKTSIQGSTTTKSRNSKKRGSDHSNAASSNYFKTSEDLKIESGNEESSNAVNYGEELDQIRQIRNRRRLKAAVSDQVEVKKPRSNIRKQKQPNIIENIPKELENDAEIELLQQTASTSADKIENINTTLQEKVDTLLTTSKTRKKILVSYKKETIPQRDRDKSELLRNKLKAIEVFRKGKKGPGYVGKRPKQTNIPKEDAGLSEDSD